MHDQHGVNPPNCPSCGYDVRSLLAQGRRRCPECGKNVPRGWFIHIEPHAPGWYLAMACLAAAPAAGAILFGLLFPVIMQRARYDLGMHLTWIVLAELYLYVLAFAFCAAHRLPRVAFGALPVSALALAPNFVTVGIFFGVWR